MKAALLAAVLVALGVVAGVGVYVGVESFQGEDTPAVEAPGTPTPEPTAETPTPEPKLVDGSAEEADCILATPPPWADGGGVFCPRECPDCFPALPPGSPEYEPCEGPQDASLPLPAYESLTKPDTSDWQRYESPNYPWSFLYPARWKLDVIESTDLYGDIRGPVREVLKLWDPTVMSHGDEIDATGGVRVSISHGPRLSGAGCSGGGRTQIVDISLMGKPTLLMMGVNDDLPVPRGDLFYSIFAGIRVSDHAAVHLNLDALSAEHLGTVRAILESMTYGAAE